MLEQIAYVGQILAAAGVILSLVYVGRQLKLTNTTSRSMVRQTMSAQMTHFIMSVASSTELAESVAKMLYSDRTRDDVSEVERVRLASCYGAILDRLHLAFEQHKEGILSKDELDAIYPSGNPWMATAFLASLWPLLKAGWPPDFIDWFERRYDAALESNNPSGSD